MSRRDLTVRLACATLVVVLAAVTLVASANDVVRTGRPVSTGGPLIQIAIVVIAAATLYIVIRVRAYLGETRPPQNSVTCPACAYHAAAFDRRCRRCGRRLDLQESGSSRSGP